MTESVTVRLSGRIGYDFDLEVAFAVPATGITALLGPSGSGKTTVLRAIAGLDRHRGEVRFGDQIWQDDRIFVPAQRRRIGYVAQGSSLLPHLSVSGNLDYAIRRVPAGRVQRDDVVQMTGIGHLLGRSPATLSGGEAQRASIARALVGQPQLLLMDEPVSGLDGEARTALLDRLETLLTVLVIPVFYVTHDPLEAERLALRTIRLRGGRQERIDE